MNLIISLNDALAIREGVHLLGQGGVVAAYYGRAKHP
jgi:hypothetical protein